MGILKLPPYPEYTGDDLKYPEPPVPVSFGSMPAMEAALCGREPTPAPLEPNCQYCYGVHTPERCPAVRAIDYYPSGKLRRVELVR